MRIQEAGPLAEPREVINRSGLASVPTDERVLVSQAKSGCQNAFGELYERHRLRIYHTVLRILGNHQDAEDAIQLSFQRAFIGLDRFREDSAFSTWLTRIAINEALMMIRRRRPHIPFPNGDNEDPQTSSVLEPPDHHPSPEQLLSQNELQTALLQAISKLRRSARSVVLLKELQGLTNAETARRLGLTVSAVKARLFQAKRHLRRHLGRRYKLPSYLIQRSERRVPCSQPQCLSGSRESTQPTIVRTETPEDNDGLSAFLSARARLFATAHRILKSAAEAEDLVQDVWIRWQTTDRGTVRDAAAFLTTMTTRLAINVIQSARSRRETSFGSSVQESVDACPDPQLKAERNENLQGAIFVLLEKLSPVERAAYVLREAFDYSYREIASVLRLEEVNARQLVTRARQHVANGQHSSVNSAEQRDFLVAFLAAAQKGALARLESLLVCSVAGSVGESERPVRTRSTLAEPITVLRRHRWPLTLRLDAKVA
jgi:RNA polymerase sigma factor (sigma-70 family)